VTVTFYYNLETRRRNFYASFLSSEWTVLFIDYSKVYTEYT